MDPCRKKYRRERVCIIIATVQRLLKKYRAAQLSTQIQILLTVFTYLPVIMILLALNIYHGQDMIRHTTLAASENMVDKSEHLSNYMQRYMEPYYKAVIDGSIWTEIEDVTRDVKSNSNRIFSLLEGYSTPTNNEVALMFLMRKDESGYLTIRLPAGQQIIVTKNNKMFYEDLIRLGNEGMDNQELVTAKLEYHSKMCLGLSQKIYNYKTKECYGSLVMLMYPETIESILESPEGGYTSYILQTTGGSLFADNENLEFIDNLQVDKTHEDEVHWTNWHLAYAVDTDKIRKDIRGSTLAAFSVVSVLFLLTILLVNIFIRRRMKALRLLEGAMSKIRKKGEYTSLPSAGNAELNSLFAGYNKMVDQIVLQKRKIQEQNEEKLTGLKKQKDAEIKALELEINSHFIYNTLNSINYTAIEHEDYETSDLLKVFANVLRYMTENRYELVTVKQEIVWLEQYLFLQRSRFDGRFDFEIDVDPEIEEKKIRKLLLQPFVENAIIHGFDRKSKGGLITVICSKEAESGLVITISDNGNGIEEDILHKIREGIALENSPENLGLGMANTCYRMRLYYGAAFIFSIGSKGGRGTTVTLKLPAL
ncbi:sensor histidine kinase [Faecalicatena contorta]|uniref:sensor histidine kinase n=1 Tax=Faecalicatena contorta TaxID=39482 RepID=UPI00129DA33B|nr:sensor histidine kinase [Faecalicatena contorta]MEE0203544.1 sensor histidine kinase [Muricomes sp.]MRM91311.1 sensor histidine kinase [Faecalicatena contorta]